MGMPSAPGGDVHLRLLAVSTLDSVRANVRRKPKEASKSKCKWELEEREQGKLTLAP